MSQPSIACFFNARKRTAVEDIKLNRAKKVLVLENESGCDVVPHSDNKINADCDVKNVSNSTKSAELQEKEKGLNLNKIASNGIVQPRPHKKLFATRNKTIKTKSNSQDIQSLINSMRAESIKKTEIKLTELNIQQDVVHRTPPSTPTRTTNALDKVKDKPEGPSLKEIKRKMTRSARLADLKASISRFQDNAAKLKEIEKKTVSIPELPKLKSFKTIELEIHTSPQKVFSPEKQYLSPKKDLGARRNLFNLLSPTKNAVPLAVDSAARQILEDTSKPALTLPYKYRYLAEMFRSVDVVCQIMFNRKETITFRKLKPAVEEMLKRNLLEKHLAQIKQIYPDAFRFTQEKLKLFGTGMKTEQWELVVTPNIGDQEHMTSEILLERRRKLFNILLNKVKHYHQEFLQSLIPPMTINKDRITRWHPEFDIERVPDIECSEIPKPPVEEAFSTAKDVLERARQMFNCNSRMDQALQRLKEMKDAETSTNVQQKEEGPPSSVLKGIPKALLEKVRQKQAAKALLSMTRSEDKEKELKVYSRLPELARLTRNVFVSEKKNVLQLDILVDKLGNCYRSHLSKLEMEEHLRILSKEFSTWLVFHVVRNCVYVKIAKSDDLSLIIHKLESLVKQKSEL